MKILDCTLRDGGYYNNWDFGYELVEEYLKAMASTGVEYVELGLRNFAKSGFLGAHAYTTEEYLNTIELPSGPSYGVMVDAKTILASDLGIKNAIDKLFVASEDSPLSFVRVAAHFEEIPQCKEIVDILKGYGYIVGLNMMQAGGRSEEDILYLSELVAGWSSSIDVLYFADSLGNMDDNEVSRINNIIRNFWKKDMGIHTHDNMSLGLSNSLHAISLGINWIDATVTGMGRGAGNTQTERLLTELGSEKYSLSELYTLVIRHFQPMQEKMKWGTNLLYFLAAKHNIHPTYVQILLSPNRYTTEEIVGAVSHLSLLDNTNSYDLDLLNSALTLSTNKSEVGGSDDLAGAMVGREVVIIANTNSLKNYKSGIESYISTRNPIVLCLNAKSIIGSDLIDYYVITHNDKYLSEESLYCGLDKPIICPFNRFSEIDKEGFSVGSIDYGMKVSIGNFSVKNSCCTVPYELTFAYAISIAINAQAQSISLIGFDGYEKGDVRQENMLNLLNIVNQNYDIKIRALTKTSYPIEEGSIYEPV